MPHDEGPATTDDFRLLLGHIPTGVVAVTATRDNRPVGLVVGSFFSISLRPPLIGFGVNNTSSSWPLISAGHTFCVNVLAADQDDVSRALATAGPDKFANLRWHTSEAGSPVIDGALAYLDCDLHTSHNAGDHQLIIGLVHCFHHLRSAAPLVFYRREYWSLSSTPGSRHRA
ncbi:flavin reductase family protein [Plantactinospora endophytica]|uniref:Monooxygenase n=1 Tax=Plantactinospora endophytica TaxID=673535 RepID=A0ABQ4E7G3_9ACTN|nr:flavin reductase family protein [Plantactinospora endophytica]GIG90644.1 monooxygenase [Plantactinospora endophytica]